VCQEYKLLKHNLLIVIGMSTFSVVSRDINLKTWSWS